MMRYKVQKLLNNRLGCKHLEHEEEVFGTGRKTHIARGRVIRSPDKSRAYMMRDPQIYWPLVTERNGESPPSLSLKPV